MKPLHAIAVAAALAIVAVLGGTAVMKTLTLGATARQASAASIATRAHKLDSFEAGLKKALRSKPPALPKVPTLGAGGVAAPAGSTLPVGASAPRVIYRRPAPIIIHKQSRHGDDRYESEAVRSSAGDD